LPGSLQSLAVVIILSVFASIMPTRKAARLTINEVLAYECDAYAESSGR
jgi:ABC-type lipoprotein release transport system permease subunit